jgi:hypothetical protein
MLRSLIEVVGDPWAFVNDTVSAAAFQMAVWEIRNETGPFGNVGAAPTEGGVASGFFYATGALLADANGNVTGPADTRLADAVTKANKWLEQVNTNQSPDNFSALVPVNGGQSQAIPVMLGRDGGGVVPEPSAACIWAGLALVGCVLQYRRRKSAG